MSEPTEIARYSPEERGNHWLVALLFIFAACSGLALYHPSFYFLSALVGGGPLTRILHPFIGVLMALFFSGLVMRFWHHNKFTDADRQWLKRIRDVIANRDEGLPEAGKYNAGQKRFFWTMVWCLGILVVSGIIMWRPYLASQFPIGLVRFATLAHAIAGFVVVLGVIVHVYAAIWVKGSLNAMIRGTVSERWARAHHRAWYREVSGK